MNWIEIFVSISVPMSVSLFHRPISKIRKNMNFKFFWNTQKPLCNLISQYLVGKSQVTKSFLFVYLICCFLGYFAFESLIFHFSSLSFPSLVSFQVSCCLTSWSLFSPLKFLIPCFPSHRFPAWPLPAHWYQRRIVIFRSRDCASGLRLSFYQEVLCISHQ